jgi:hypothetical protein
LADPLSPSSRRPCVLMASARHPSGIFCTSLRPSESCPQSITVFVKYTSLGPVPCVRSRRAGRRAVVHVSADLSESKSRYPYVYGRRRRMAESRHRLHP